MGQPIYGSTTSQEYEENIKVTLKRLRHSHLNYVIYFYLNINSIRNKFGDLAKTVDGNADILCVAVITLYINIISPYILDITENKGGMMVFLKSHIPSRRLNDFKIPSNIQIIPLEINLRKEKMVSCINL